MVDIDVLIEAEQFESVCKRAVDSGFVQQPATRAARYPEHHERAFLLGKILVEFHQAFIQRPRHRIDYDAIWRRRVPLEIGSCRAFRLDEVDALTYHALSMAIDEFQVRLIRFVDLWLLLHQRNGIAIAAVERAGSWQAKTALYGALTQACRLFPDFRTPEIDQAIRSVLPLHKRRFIDRWVLPTPIELRHRRPPHRSVQLWRKACLLDNSARRVEFALYHGLATIRGGRV
jgi:hypothetical protein